MVPSLKKWASRSFGYTIAESGRNIIFKYHKNPDLGLKKLQDIVQILKTEIRNVPENLHHELCFIILNVLERHFLLYQSLYGSQVLKELLSIVTHLKLYKLSLSEVPYSLRFELYFHLWNWTSLKQLEINQVIMIKNKNMKEMEESIIKALSNFTNLHKLTLYSNCTDRIIKVVQQNCPNLWYLNVKFSESVTNDSVPFIIKCTNLKEIELAYTFISTSGYVDLFFGQTGLTRIMIKADMMNEILTKMIALKPVNLTLNITNLHINNIRMTHMHFISKSCPNLKILSASCDGANFALLSNLIYLEELAITKANFNLNGIEALLTKLGKNIKVLKFYRVNDVSLISINETCPKLKRLMIDSCNFRKNNVNYKTSAVACFKYLEHVTCGESVPKMCLELLLSNCLDIKCLYLSDVGVDLTDQNMLILLKRNPMFLLEELCIYKSKCLSMTSINFLTKNCKKLKKLFGLDKFASISATELTSFARNNRSLNLNTLMCPMFLEERFKLPW